MAIPSPRDLKPLGPYSRGANNIANESSLPASHCRSAVNVDWYPGGRFRRRLGNTTDTRTAGANQIWSDGHYSLIRVGTTLGHFVPGEGITTIFDGLNPDNPMVYCIVNQHILVSDGDRSLRVDPMTDAVREWGIEAAGAPQCASTAIGGLDAGAYQVAITYADADGEEGGASLATTIDVPQGGGVAITSIPAPLSTAVKRINIYFTKPNDAILLHYFSVPFNATTVNLGKKDYGRPLRSQHLVPIPGVTAAAFTGGRLWFVIDNVVGYSNSLYYGQWDPAGNYFAYPAKPTLLAPASTAQASTTVAGIFVGTLLTKENAPPLGRTYFLSGTGPEDYRNVPAYGAGAIPGTLVYIEGEKFQDPNIPSDVVPVWVATNGSACVGLLSGNVRGLTSGKFAMAVGARGSAAYREINGICQVLFSMQAPSTTLPIEASDSLSIMRSKNGIVQQ